MLVVCSSSYVSMDNKVRELRGKSSTYRIPEYHCGHLQSTPLGKLCADASA